MTLLEEDFALLLDFAELLLDFAELLEAMLLLDFTELLLDRSSTGAEDDERTELLDTLVSLSLDFGVTLEDDERTLLLEATLDDERTELLDRSSTPSAELRAGSAEDDEHTTLDDDSSLRGAKLLSSSPQATTKNAKRRANKKCINPPNPFYLKYTFC